MSEPHLKLQIFKNQPRKQNMFDKNKNENVFDNVPYVFDFIFYNEETTKSFLLLFKVDSDSLNREKKISY